MCPRIFVDVVAIEVSVDPSFGSIIILPTEEEQLVILCFLEDTRHTALVFAMSLRDMECGIHNSVLVPWLLAYLVQQSITSTRRNKPTKAGNVHIPVLRNNLLTCPGFAVNVQLIRAVGAGTFVCMVTAAFASSWSFMLASMASISSSSPCEQWKSRFGLAAHIEVGMS